MVKLSPPQLKISILRTLAQKHGMLGVVLTDTFFFFSSCVQHSCIQQYKHTQLNILCPLLNGI